MFNMESIGRKIAELRKKANMSQMELADCMGITFQSISNWKRRNTMPDISKLPELAELFTKGESIEIFFPAMSSEKIFEIAKRALGKN